MTSDIKSIISELKEPFAPEVYKIRDVPGGGQWIFVEWQTYREKLDQVVPDWEVEYSSPTYDEKNCMIKCTLSIRGVRREAWGCVATIQAEKNGKDVSRGSAIDRAVAEAFKNAAESFGVGAHLDDQEFCLRVAMKSKYAHIKEELMRYSKKLKIDLGIIQQPKTVRQEYEEVEEAKGVRGSAINANQVKLVWARVNKNKISTIRLQGILKNYGYTKVEEIENKKLDKVLDDIAASSEVNAEAEVNQANQNNHATPNTRPTLDAPSNGGVNLKGSQVSNPNDSGQNFQQAAPPARLYPKHAAIVQNIRAITKHDKDAVIEQCKVFGKIHPADLTPHELHRVLETLATDWAIINDVIKSKKDAIASFSEYVNHFVSQGQGIEGAVIAWMNAWMNQAGIKAAV